jgi:hypothetical protein
MLRRRDPDEIRPRDRVVAVQPVKDIAEGSQGVVKMVVGQTWVRYLVEWDNGEWIGTIDGSKIVRAERLDEYRRRQAQAAAEAERKAAEPAPVAAAATEGGGGGGRVPEHLLERSRQARARLEAAS